MTMLAVNHLTPVVGIDVHWVNLPPSPAPVPLPHPHVGVVLDLREYANAALAVMGSIVFSFVEEQVGAFVQAHEQQIDEAMQSDLVQSGLGAVDAVMNNDVVKGGMDALNAANALQRKVSDALGGQVGSGGGGAPVTINGLLRATAGTHTFHAPGLHFPLGAGFAASDARGPSQDAESFMGSRTVLANGDPMSFQALPALSCWCAGMLPMSHNSAHTDRKYMSLPTATMLPVPADRPVLVGGPPVMNMMAMAAGLFRAFRGSALAKRLFKNFPSGFIKCVIFDAEPVNSITGEVVVQQHDFTIEGRLPLVWDRYYASHDAILGSLGRGWRSPADIRVDLLRDEGHETAQYSAAVTFADHATAFDQMPHETGWLARTHDRQHGHALYIEHGELRIRTRAGLEYAFPLPDDWRARVPVVDRGQTLGLPLSRMADLNGNAWHIERRTDAIHHGVSMRFIEYAGGRPTGRELRAASGIVAGCLGAFTLHDAQGGDHPLVTYQQDALGNLGAVRDAHNAPYCFEYVQHQMVRHTDRNGLSFYYSHAMHDDGQWRVSHAWGDGGLYDYHFEYDLAHLETRFTDSLGHLTVLQYNEQQWPVARIDGAGGVRSYQYDGDGRTIAEIDPAGNATEWEYDGYGNLLAHRLPDRTVVRTAYDEQHRPVAITDPEGGVWRQVWDTRGNLIEQLTPSGCSNAFAYDAHGQLTQVADAARRCTALGYDAYGYLASLTDALGRVTRFTHDPRGNLLHRESPGEGTTRYAWDKKDRLILCDLPSGAWVRCEYDGEDNLIRYEDEARQETRFTYYGQGQLQTRTDPDGSVTRYHYDTEEQLIGVSNPLGQTWHLKRDAAGRLIEEIDYFGQARRYGYDPAGHLKRTVDPLGRVLSIRCDPLGRIVSRIAEGSGEDEHYAYNKRGQLIEARNAHGLVERDYDLDGRLTSEMQKHVDMLGSLSYEYDAAGQLQTQQREMRGLNGDVCYRQTLSHEYDELGLARTLSIDTHEPIRFTHDLASRLSGIEFAPGLDHAFSYDSAGRLARQTARRAGHRETHIGYEYDVSGNLVTRNDSRLGVDRYRYDPLGRIVAHTDPGQRLRRYVYDAQGDRFSQVRATEQGREWHHPDGARWWLDAAGQLRERTHRARGVERFTWDVFGRMVGFENTANERWVYRYDALGRRIGKQAGDVRAETGQRHRDEGARTWFLWDGDAMAGEVRRTALCESEARFYVYRQDGFEPLAMQVDDGACKRIYFYQNDPNGAPVRLSGADGDFVWETHYSVAGGVEWCETRKIEQAIRLQGQYYDAESNLHYNRYRYFDPQTGIFISQDPIGLAGGLNPYQFAPNAFGWIDPRGLNTAPVLPNNIIATDGNTSIVHYYESSIEHADPIHFHIEEGGRSIGKVKADGRLLNGKSNKQADRLLSQKSTISKMRKTEKRLANFIRKVRRSIVGGRPFRSGGRGPKKGCSDVE